MTYASVMQARSEIPDSQSTQQHPSMRLVSWPSSRQLSGPSIRRRCLLLAGRSLCYNPPHRALLQLYVGRSRLDDRDKFGLRWLSHDRKQQGCQAGGEGNVAAGASKYAAPQMLAFLIFPFGSRAEWARTPRMVPRSRYIPFAKWNYRLLWFLMLVYTADKYYNRSLSANHAIFNPPRFTPFSVIDKQDVSPTSFILTLHPHADVSPDIEPYADSWKQGTWSVEFKQPQLHIARSYTPLPPKLDMQSSPDLRFLIRREKNGEVSNYLANLPPNAIIEIRGPQAEVDLPTDATDIVFLAGGTGIAPAMQVAYTLLEKRTEGQKPKIHIIWANRRRADCVGGLSSSPSRTASERKSTPHLAEGVVRELQLMRTRHPEHLSVDYLVDEERTFLDQKMISASTRRAAGDMSSKLLFVSGPEGFVSFFAGPKRWEDGQEKQGELGGVLGQMGLKGWQVWKM